MMKSGWLRSQVASILVASFVVLSAAPGNAQAAVVKVPAGTTVTLRTSGPISPETAKPGDPVTLVVANDVVVEGRVVIKAGAPAKGEVTRSEARGIAGKPDRIAISIQSVTAADGAMIPVSATKSAEGEDKVVITIVLALLCLPLIFMKGGEAAIGAGSTINAATNGIAEVKVAVAGEPAASPAVEDATAVAGAQPLEAIE